MDAVCELHVITNNKTISYARHIGKWSQSSRIDRVKHIECKQIECEIHTTWSDHRTSETVGNHHAEDEQKAWVANAELKIEIDHFAYFLVLGLGSREQQIVEKVEEELAEAQQLHRIGDERRLDHIVDKERAVIDRKQALNGAR